MCVVLGVLRWFGLLQKSHGPAQNPLGAVGRFHVMVPTGVAGWDFVWAFSNHLSSTVGEDSWVLGKEKE